MNCFCNCCEERDVEERSRQRDTFYATHRLLLLGAEEAGKSTIMKQMKILYKDGFSDEERLQYVVHIRNNIREIILAVTHNMSMIDPPITLQNQENLPRLTYIQDVIHPLQNSETKFPPEFYEHCIALWADSGVQACYRRSNEYQLIDSASYFMDTDKLSEVSSPNYLPSDDDILRARHLTKGTDEIQFVHEKVNFQMCDTGGYRLERDEWMLQYNDVTAIIYVVACSSFNMVVREDELTNRLRESLTLFEQEVWNNRWLKKISVILFLNKMDILKDKVESGWFRIEDYFPDFASYSPPYEAYDPNESAVFTKAKYYIRDHFLRITQRSNDGTHFCYPHFTTAVNTENIRKVFDSCREIIQRIHLMKYELL